MKKKLAYSQGIGVENLGPGSKMMSGFVSGLLCWVPAFPFVIN